MTAENELSEAELAVQVDTFLDAWFRVRQVVQKLNYNRVYQYNLSTTQFIVMNLMEEAEARHHPTTIGGLARLLNLDPATIVRTVDSLEKQGLVARRRDTIDRRVVFVEFSDEGRAIQNKSQQHFKEAVLKIFEMMSADGRTGLVKGLQEFVSFGQVGTVDDAT